jgi:broad-specificity NMP kinase
MITCPNCGRISKDEILIYNENLRKQNIRISPVLPVCRHCGAEAAVSHTCRGGNIIVLNGTCGSGKTTVAELLADRGFAAIDGDCVIQSVRHKSGRKQYLWNELIDEIAHEIDILSMFGENIVLSHIVLPEDTVKYIDIFRSRGMNYKIFLLRPECKTAAERCRTRTCHTSKTPEIWIKHFYDLLVPCDRAETVDNTAMTAEETAEYILSRFTVNQ